MPEQNNVGMTTPEPGGDQAGTLRPPNEALRAWGWHVVSWSICVIGLAALVLGGVLAVQQLGTALGIVTTLVLAVLALGTVTWLATGRTRP